LCLFRFFIGCPLEDAVKAIDKGVIIILLKNLQSYDTKLVDYSLQALYKLLEHGDNMKRPNQQFNPLVMEIVQNNLHQVFDDLHQHKEENIRIKVEVLANKFFNNDLEM